MVLPTLPPSSTNAAPVPAKMIVPVPAVLPVPISSVAPASMVVLPV